MKLVCKRPFGNPMSFTAARLLCERNADKLTMKPLGLMYQVYHRWEYLVETWENVATVAEQHVSEHEATNWEFELTFN